MRGTLSNILMVLCCAAVVVGAAVLVGIWAVPQYDAYQAETQFTSMRATSSGASSSPAGSSQLSAAKSYNSALAGESAGSPTPYSEQLNLVDEQVLSWVEIPSINLYRPLYHYDNEEVLMAGLGHIEGTSLPVGGESTHCVITGHSGMPGSRMLDDLRKVEVGDVFVLWTLGDPYAYKVYDIEVVEPDDVSSLGIQKGRDLATIITCTPYGVNSHRLLVHGERTAYSPDEIAAAEGTHPTSDRLLFLAGGVAAAAAAVGTLLYSLVGRRTWHLASVANSAGQTVAAKGGQASAAAGAGSAPVADVGSVQVELKPFHRATLSVDGTQYAGRWSRAAGGDVVIDLAGGGAGLNVPVGGLNVELASAGQVHLANEGGKLVMSANVDGVTGTATFLR